MHRLIWRSLGCAVAGVGLAVAAGIPAHGQEYPSRSITAVVGYAAGTGADLIGRYFAEKLHALAGQPVVVENKPGALTKLAAEYVARAKPDGYTIFITAGNSTFSSNPHLFKKLDYDPIKDFTPVTTLASLPFLVTVAAKSPINSVKDLTAFLKAKGAKATYAYPNAFSQAATEYYKKIVGVDPVGVAYKATPAALTDMLAGDVDFIFMDASFGIQQEQQGQVKILAVTTAQRSAVAPQFPGMAEAGVPGFDLSAWWAVWLPAHAPQAVVDKLAGWFNQIVATDETAKYLVSIGCAPLKGNARMISEMLPKEIEKWGEIIRLAKIPPQ